MKTPQTPQAFARWLKSRFADLDALSASADFYDQVAIAETVETANRYAARFGAPVEPEKTLVMPREALATIGRLLAWTERRDQAELLSVAEVGRLLGLSVRTVWRGVSAGEIPAPVKVLGSTRWKRSDLETMLATLTSTGS